ncbi:hypothetical protein, partial [Pectobacterium polaris]|uniref:hypothetical protein n=1 Tax=Pectobacterium polaris TaxID=2042057 RepID=UPI0020BDD705
SEVKRRSADGSVGLPHVRVGNCQASNKWKAPVERQGLFAMGKFLVLAAKICSLLWIYLGVSGR